ncbi:hypothetical protein ERO13_A04G080900v2 [Gossypium hirsutum]|uniref:Uncharacterized protein n=1 Tax=Gossypium tomentosum TaxID=34277 RepID=A0A5D2QWY1_GOSTO|nr:hypothetical protein ERO13_A04G080900v2 [Gossypium hirsutum]TYI33151.1 hypothetical protein ES332_A04G112400v1 [Gossypium tomentosum]
MLSFPLPSKSQRFYGVRRYRSFQNIHKPPQRTEKQPSSSMTILRSGPFHYHLWQLVPRPI